MSAQHTPGPWRYWSCRVDSGSGMTDYVQFSGPKANAFRVPLRYLSEADARLIAAAPDLLEALIAIRDCKHTPDLWGRVNAAIAKATGSAES